MKLSEKIAMCQKCAELAQSRTQVVIGEGPIPCPILFLGEAPGRKEDETGVPFCGVAGDIMDAAAFRAGLKRKQHFHILNVIKCRPPENRDPSSEEIKNCRPFLVKQISVIKPTIIVAFGRFAQSFVLHTPPENIRVLENVGTTVKTEWKDVNGNPTYAILSYHPAFVARNRNSDIEETFCKHLKLAKKLKAKYFDKR